MILYLLTDKTRLQEIYDLRVEAWEQSANYNLINKKICPNGWSDELDESGLHWIITNDKSEIIASARLNILNNISLTPHFNDFSKVEFQLPSKFAYISRLVIKSEYRNLNLSKTFDKARINYALQNSLEVIVAHANGRRINTLKKYGFRKLFSFKNKILSTNKNSILEDFLILHIDKLQKEKLYR